MSNQEERTNVQPGDGKNDFALKAMSKHLPMHLCGFYIGDPYPHNAHIPKALTMFGLCRGEEICSNWRKSHEVLYFEDLLQMTCMLGLGIQVFFLFFGLGPKHF